MARGELHQKDDQRKIDLLKSKNPALTTEEALVALQLEWIERVAGSYQSGMQPAFGYGFESKDDVWLGQVIQAIKDKASPRPRYPDSTIEAALAAAGL